MASVLESRIDNIQQYIISSWDGSYRTLKALKTNGLLDAYLEEIDSDLKQELTSFVYLLFDNNYDSYPYLRRIMLNESPIAKIFNGYGYMLSLYTNGTTDGFLRFHVFLKNLIDKYQIFPFMFMSEEEILNRTYQCMDLIIQQDPNRDNMMTYKPNPVILDSYGKYEKYQNCINTIMYDLRERDGFSVFAEQHTFIMELSSVKQGMNIDPTQLVSWVSKDHGDFYGYDVLSYNYATKKQKIIEVKSGSYDYCYLTTPENRMLHQAIKNGCEYYIYKYQLADPNKNTYNMVRLKYNPLYNNFIDIDNNRVYSIAGDFILTEVNNNYILKPKMKITRL